MDVAETVFSSYSSLFQFLILFCKIIIAAININTMNIAISGIRIMLFSGVVVAASAVLTTPDELFDGGNVGSDVSLH